MRSLRAVRPWRLVLAATMLFVSASGCSYVTAAAYLFGPPRVQKAEFKLTDGRLAVVIETAHPEEDSPVFRQALLEKMSEIFRENKLKTKIIPDEELLRLHQQNADFADWSLQKIGRRLDAKQVLYVRIEQLQMRDAPDSPLLSPRVDMRLKVIDPFAQPDKARLWPGPNEREGREADRARPPRDVADPTTNDTEAAKLGRDTAYVVAQWFYDVDLETKTPWEK